MTPTVPYRPLPIDQDGVLYEHGPDSFPAADVPPGRTVVVQMHDSTAYPGTSRNIWVHLPATAPTSAPLPAVVFQDGGMYLGPEGECRGGIVLDTLIHRGDILPMVGVFVDPGVLTRETDPGVRKNRNREYDADHGRYADFLIGEVLPLVSEHVALRQDHGAHGICGGSSGGNAAFTAAWHRPDVFGRVIGFLSSFTQMPGGNPYPRRIREEPRKDLRIFLQAGHRDLNWDRPERNWLAENLRTAAALAEAGYDMRLVLGDGGHSPNHGGVLLPDALRWVWRPLEVA